MQLRRYLKANRKLLGDDTVTAYEQGINDLMKGYTDTAKRVTEDRRDYWSEFADQQDYERRTAEAKSRWSI